MKTPVCLRSQFESAKYFYASHPVVINPYPANVENMVSS